jgi:hypothetical protein
MMKTVYLAGGMKELWRKRVKLLSPAYVYFDPCDHHLILPSQYTFWDLEAIRRCDYVFGYMEKTNPSGVGLALEIGYAVGLGKPVFFVNEKKDDEHWHIVQKTATVVFDDIYTGIDFLNRLAVMD